jgi:Tfp pilus assembly protein PilX
MNKFVKLSSSALLVAGFVVAGSAMAAGIPSLVTDNMSVAKSAANAAAGVDIVVVTNDLNMSTSAGTVTLGSKPKYGTATCTGNQTTGKCTYKPTNSSVGKSSDSFTYVYTYTYTDNKGKSRSGAGSATVNVTLTSTAGSL